MLLVEEEKLSFMSRGVACDKEFVINHSMAPSYLPLRVLEKVRKCVLRLIWLLCSTLYSDTVSDQVCG